MTKIDVTYANHVQQRLAVAQDVYKDISTDVLPGGWHRTADSTQTMGHGNGLFAAVYERTVSDNPEYMIAFRGLDDWRDIDDIAKIKFGGLPQQVFNALAFSQNIAHKHGVELSSMSFTGHSLGGYLARAIGMVAQSSDIIAFNSPGLYRNDVAPLDTLRKNFNSMAPSITAAEIEQRVQNFNAKDDLVSRFGQLRGTVMRIPTEDGSPHSINTLGRSFVAFFMGGESPPAAPTQTAAAQPASPPPFWARRATPGLAV